MSTQKTSSHATATAHTFGPLYDCGAAWESFRFQWANWLSQAEWADPIYCLPEEVVAILEKPVASSRPIIERSSAEAERQLLHICRKANAVGFWQGNVVVYPHLSPRPSVTSLESLLQNYSGPERQAALALVKTADSMTPRLAGVVGWLRTEPAYVQAAEKLALCWSKLPTSERPTFPLSRALSWPRHPTNEILASDAAAQFARNLLAFLDHWELMQLATWDLPCPHGPLLPNPLPSSSPAAPTQGINLHVPLHYPFQVDDDLQRHISRLQQRTAEDKGLNPSLAGLRHHRAYEQILQVLHLKKIIVHRYGRTRRPKAFMTHVETAIAAALACGVDNVKKLRKAISQCLRGKRESVRWLHVPVR